MHDEVHYDQDSEFVEHLHVNHLSVAGDRAPQYVELHDDGQSQQNDLPNESATEDYGHPKNKSAHKKPNWLLEHDLLAFKSQLWVELAILGFDMRVLEHTRNLQEESDGERQSNQVDEH